MSLSAPAILTAWAFWLRPLSPLVAVDALFVPNGDPDYARTQAAAAMFRRGFGRWLVCSGDGAGGDSAAEMAEVAIRAGVPKARILIESQATSTWENAVLSLPLLQAHGMKRVLIVSSPYHLRRMKGAAIAAWPGVTVLTSADDEPFDPTWWLHAGGWQRVGSETLKLMGYGLMGRLAYRLW